MKKVVINIILILVIILTYFLQMNFFDWFTIASVMPNLFIVLVLFIGLFATRQMAVIYGIIIGLILDFLVGKVIGVNAVTLGLIGFLSAVFDKNFSKDNRITIMFMVLGATLLGETLSYLINYVVIGNNLEIFNYIKILIIEIIYNLLLTIIIYPLIQKFGYYIENEYKGNKILTRYF